MAMTKDEVSSLAAECASLSPEKVLAAAIERFDDIALAFSGAEDVVLIDMGVRIRKDLPVFCIDTGRLPAETYRFIDAVRKRYDLEIDVMFPEAAAVEQLVLKKGFFSFYEDGHQECCSIRKVEPLRRKLETVGAWVTGQRRDQSPGTRRGLTAVEVDTAFSTESNPLVKFNPLTNWTSVQVWDYIQLNDVPFNELHRKGFVSIGCEPCTRATLPNEQERQGRWWWEQSNKKECGLHVINLEE